MREAFTFNCTLYFSSSSLSKLNQSQKRSQTKPNQSITCQTKPNQCQTQRSSETSQMVVVVVVAMVVVSVTVTMTAMNLLIDNLLNMLKLIDTARNRNRTSVFETVLFFSFFQEPQEQRMVQEHQRNNESV